MRRQPKDHDLDTRLAFKTSPVECLGIVRLSLGSVSLSAFLSREVCHAACEPKRWMDPLDLLLNPIRPYKDKQFAAGVFFLS